MKVFLIIGGIFMIIFGGLIPLPNAIEEYNVQQNGTVVQAVITFVPNCLGTKTKHFMHFAYKGQEYDKAVGCGFSDNYKKGDTINLKHQENSDIFLFEEEHNESNLIVFALLIVLGIVFITKGLRKN